MTFTVNGANKPKITAKVEQCDTESTTDSEWNAIWTYEVSTSSGPAELTRFVIQSTVKKFIRMNIKLTGEGGTYSGSVDMIPQYMPR